MINTKINDFIDTTLYFCAAKKKNRTRALTLISIVSGFIFQRNNTCWFLSFSSGTSFWLIFY